MIRLRFGRFRDTGPPPCVARLRHGLAMVMSASAILRLDPSPARRCGGRRCQTIIEADDDGFIAIIQNHRTVRDKVNIVAASRLVEYGLEAVERGTRRDPVSRRT